MRAPGLLSLLLVVACGGRYTSSETSLPLEHWPGGPGVVAVDAPEQFQSNLSGLAYESDGAHSSSPGVMWAVSNGPGKLYKLLSQGPNSLLSDPDGGWPAGKLLHYPGGRGEANAESVTFTESSADGLYVAAKHDNDNLAISRLSVLRYDVSGSEAELSATHEWDLTAALPPMAANSGLEALTWIPDSFLIERGFLDSTLAPYDPNDYPGHGRGLFLVGVEQSGMVYGFALDHDDGSSHLLVGFQAPHLGVMGLEMNHGAGQLWVHCDEACGNRASVFDIDTDSASPTVGQFRLRHIYQRPMELINTNHEGIAMAPDSECDAAFKPFFWADDNDTAGHSIRQGGVLCGAL